MRHRHEPTGDARFFELIFLLAIDEHTQIARLEAAGSRDAAARAQVVAGRPIFEAEMRAAGARVLDGSRPTARVADRVLLEAAARLAQPSTVAGGTADPLAAFADVVDGAHGFVQSRHHYLHQLHRLRAAL